MVAEWRSSFHPNTSKKIAPHISAILLERRSSSHQVRSAMRGRASWLSGYSDEAAAELDYEHSTYTKSNLIHWNCSSTPVQRGSFWNYSMLGLLKQASDTLRAAAQNVADEFNQHQNEQKPPLLLGEVEFFGKGGRIVLSGFPELEVIMGSFRPERSLRPFASPEDLLEVITTRFSRPNVVVWNLSGKKYNYEELQGQIIEYDFPARPIPPFSALKEIAGAIRTWIDEDDSNVAVIHDISGRRSATVVACVLEMFAHYPRETGMRVVTSQLGPAGKSLVGSQIRYHTYFCDYLANPEADRSKELYVQRVIMNGVPDFTYPDKLSTSDNEASCVPFMRILNSTGLELGASDVPTSPVCRLDESISFVPARPTRVQGDIIIRFFHRHLGVEEATEVAMFALCFHVGFVREMVLRFKYSEIDGTKWNPRFLKTMFVDVILSESHAQVLDQEQSRHEEQSGHEEQAPSTSPATTDVEQQVQEEEDVLKEIEAALRDVDNDVDGQNLDCEDLELSDVDEEYS